jgi:Skp family chaperone for outer membrane proteins
MKSVVVAVALSVMLTASPVFASASARGEWGELRRDLAAAAVGREGGQAPAAAQPPAKPAPTTPAPAPAPAQPPAPKPFPQGAKVAYVVLQRIANESADGRVATTRIQALQQKKAAELNERNKQLTGLQQKLEKEGSVMSANAAADLQKQVEKLNLDVQRFTQDAQAEVQELQQVATEMGLQFVFNGPDAGLVWADSALDISAEVIKKLDASSGKPAPKPAAPTKPPGR